MTPREGQSRMTTVGDLGWTGVQGGIMGSGVQIKIMGSGSFD